MKLKPEITKIEEMDPKKFYVITLKDHLLSDNVKWLKEVLMEQNQYALVFCDPNSSGLLTEIPQELYDAHKFVEHIKAHKEVQEAPIHPGEVMCKICNKTLNEIVNKK